MKRYEMYGLVLLGFCGAMAVHTLKVNREEAEKRAKVARDIYAIQIGAERIKEKIQSGEYRPKNFDDLATALEFEQLAAYNDG